MITLARCYLISAALSSSSSSSSSSTSNRLPLSFLNELEDSTETLLVENPCPPTQALFLQLLALLSSKTDEQLPFYTALICCSQLARARLTPGAASILHKQEIAEDASEEIGMPKQLSEEELEALEEEVARANEESLSPPSPSTSKPASFPSPGTDLLYLASTRFLLSQPPSTLSSELISSTLLGTGDETAEIVLLYAEDNLSSFASVSSGLVSTKALIARAVDRSSARCRQPALRLLAGRDANEAGGYEGLDVGVLLAEFDQTKNEPLKEDLLPVIARSIAAGGDVSSNFLIRCLPPNCGCLSISSYFFLKVFRTAVEIP